MAFNLMTDSLPTLAAAFDLLEGEGFFAKSLRSDGKYSLAAAIRWVYAAKKHCYDQAVCESVNEGRDLAQTHEEAVQRYCDRFHLYGSGGSHRYAVDMHGNILFSLRHASRGAGARARDVGFDTF